MNRFIFAMLLALATSACSTVATELSDDTFYKLDLSLWANGYYTEKRGAMVVPKAESYTIKASGKTKFDFLIVKTCHRKDSFENLGESFTYDYKPVVGVEDNRACPVEIMGAEKLRGRHVGAFIDFEDERNTLPAVGDCDRNHLSWNGVGVCQGPAGLFQRIVFETEVVAESGTSGCKTPESEDSKTFVFKQGRGRCLIKFMEKASPHRAFRLNTLGYDEIVPREI